MMELGSTSAPNKCLNLDSKFSVLHRRVKELFYTSYL